MRVCVCGGGGRGVERGWKKRPFERSRIFLKGLK